MRKYGLVGKVLAAVIAVAMKMAVCDHTALFLGGLIIAVLPEKRLGNCHVRLP